MIINQQLIKIGKKNKLEQYVQYKMQISSATIKIAYKTITESYTGIPLQQINNIKLDDILNIVNKFIQDQSIQQFLDIQIKYINIFTNIYDIFGQCNRIQFHVDVINNSYLIQLLLIQSKPSANYNQIFKSWQDKIISLTKKFQDIQEKSKKHAEMIQDQYGIDLAFFYAEPKVQKLDNKDRPYQYVNNEVSFMLQVKKIFQKLSNQHAIRSAKIQIQAATISNLYKALSRGVKILHFSCHGQQDKGLQIEGQDQHFSVVKYLNCQQLIKILLQQKRTPQIIVFNACQSDKLAQQIHQIKININTQNPKHITTIGYNGKISDVICQKFAQTFYSKIFKGQSIQDFFTASQNQNKQVKIFYKSTQKIRLKPSKINELNRYIDIKNKLKNQTQFQYFPKIPLYYLMKKMIKMKKYSQKDQCKILHVTGQSNIGKTKLVQKALNYLWQRDHITKLIKIQLKQSEHIISNILQFKIKLNQKKQQLKNNKHSQYLSIVIDNCQHIMKYQQPQFQSAINQLNRQLQNTDFMIIIITSQNTTNTIDKYHVDKSYQQLIINKSKSSNIKIHQTINNQIQYLQKQSESSFFQRCSSYICQEISKLPVKFLLQLPLISIFPAKLQQNTQKLQIPQQPLIFNLPKSSKRKLSQSKLKDQFLSVSQYQSQQILKQSQKKIIQIQHLRDKILSDKTQSQQKLITIFLILQSMQYILAIYFLRLNSLLQFQQKILSENKFKQDLNNLIKTTHKFINVCLAIKIGYLTISDKVKQLYEAFQFKLYFIIYYAYSLSGQKGRIGKQTTKKFLQTMKTENNLSWTTLSKHLKFIQKSKYIASLVLDNEKQLNKNYYHFQNNYIQDHLNDIDNLNSQLTSNRFSYCHLGQPINDIQQQHIKEYKFQFLIFDKNSINLLLLLLIPIIKSIFNNRIQAENKIKILMDTIKQFYFINDSNNIFAHLFKYFYQDYIQCLFQLEKLKLSIKDISNLMKKSDTIDKLNQWIKICRKQNFISLRNKITNYKNLFFNYFVALVSFPTNKLYRFEYDIMQMIWKSCQNLKYSIFPRINCFSKQIIEKYNQNCLPIPIALFIVDTVVKQKQKKKQKQTYFILQHYTGKNQKQIEHTSYLSINQINFFKCQIAIFCGKCVIQNIPKDKLKQKVGFAIFIDTNIKISTTNNQKKKRQKSIDEEQLYRHRETFQQVSQGLIIRQMLINFYSQLCKRIYSQKYDNRGQQIKQSYQIAKDHAYISCLLKFGMYFHQNIQRLYHNFTYDVVNKNIFEEKPLILSKISEICHNQQLEKVIQENNNNKKNNIIENLQQGTQIGYCQQLHLVMQKILKYCTIKNSNKSYHLMLICKNNEKQAFMKNLNMKLRKMGILQIKKIKIKQKSDYQIRNINGSFLKTPYQTTKQEQNVLQIIQLQQIDDEHITKQDLIAQIKQKFRIQENLHNLQPIPFARIILYFSHQFILNRNNNQDDTYPQLQQMTQIQINKLSSLQNLLPMLYRRLILKKSSQTQIDKSWPNNELNYIYKKLYDINNQKKINKLNHLKSKQLQKFVQDILHIK